MKQMPYHWLHLNGTTGLKGLAHAPRRAGIQLGSRNPNPAGFDDSDRTAHGHIVLTVPGCATPAPMAAHLDRKG
jgi:hypothetical protein